jgi:stress response protein YsnF
MQKLSMFPGITDHDEPEIDLEAPATEVHVLKSLDQRQESIHEPLMTEHVEIERILKNERVDGPQSVREEGDTVIVPVVRQVLRIEKEWILTEEIHLKRRREEAPVSAETPLYEERAQIKRGVLGGRAPAFKGKLAS